MTPHSNDSLAAVHRLKQEIDRLTQEQVAALKSATYLGMTPAEAKEHDDRRYKITQFVQELRLLDKPYEETTQK